MPICIRCKQPSETTLCPECRRAPLETIESPHAMPQPAAGVTIEPYAGGPCWIVRDASGAESLLTADRTSAELRAERLRIMGGRWKTAEQLCDMIMDQRRREVPTPRERLDAAMMKSLCRDDAAAEIATAGLTRVRDELKAAEELGATWKRQHGELAKQLAELHAELAKVKGGAQ